MQAIKSIGESICGKPSRSTVLPPVRRRFPRWQFRNLAVALAVTAVVAAAMTFHPSAAHAEEEEGGEAGRKAVAANSLARMPNLQGNIAAIREGKRVYHVHCAECHGNTARGGMGPNLSDDIWLNDASTYEKLVAIITYGVKGRPMRPWGTKLPAMQIRQVAALILYLRECPDETWKSCIDPR